MTADARNNNNEKNNEKNNERQLAPELLAAAEDAGELVHVRVEPSRIDWFNKIIEGYDNLALVSTLDAREGRLCCWVTADMRPVLEKLLSKMRGVEIL